VCTSFIKSIISEKKITYVCKKEVMGKRLNEYKISVFRYITMKEISGHRNIVTTRVPNITAVEFVGV
jgi:hypothetical protein